MSNHKPYWVVEFTDDMYAGKFLQRFDTLENARLYARTVKNRKPSASLQVVKEMGY